MVEEIITKEIADELMKIEGETRAISIKGDIEYVVYKRGKEALEKIESEMKSLGYPIEYEKMRTLDFYPVGLEVIALLVTKKLFNFSDKEFVKMGEFNSKFSLVVRLFMKYFVSIKAIAKQAPKMWKKLYSIGELEITEINEKEKYTVLKIKNFKLHPLHCLTIKGYISNVMKMVIGSNVRVQENKCVFNKNDYHEFLIKW